MFALFPALAAAGVELQKPHQAAPSASATLDLSGATLEFSRSTTVAQPLLSAATPVHRARISSDGVGTTITHSTSQTILAGNSVSCNAGGLHADNAYLRRFDLGAFGITNDFDVTEVQVGVEQAIGAGGSQPVTVNLYTWDPADPFTYANFVAIGTAGATVADQSLTILTVPVAGTAPAGSTLVVELFTPDGQVAGHSFFVGSNNLGQTAPTFIAAADCGIAEPTDTAVIGFPGMHLVMNVTGTEQGGGATTVCGTPALAIPDNDPTGASTDLVVADTGTLQDLDVSVVGPHTWVGDVRFQLTHVDTGTSVTFYDRPGVPASTFGCSSDNNDFTASDEGTDGAIETTCLGTPPAIAGNLVGGDPVNNALLAAFDGEDMSGTWRLTASDHASGDTGSVNEWCVLLDGGPPPPDITVDPTSLGATLDAGQQTTLPLTIGNIGSDDLDWSITEAAPPLRQVVLGGDAPAGAVPLILDDGVAENAIGLTAGGQFVWLNRFTPSPADYPFDLTEISVLFRSADGVNVGELVDLYVYEDADGNPANGATHVGSLTGQAVQALDAFSVYPLPALTLNGPGDVLIAVVNRTAGTDAGEFPAAIDQTASQVRSWIGLYAGNPADPPVLPAPTFGTIDSFGFAGNWMVRGLGTHQAGACASPTDVPWLSVSPVSGSTAGGATSNVDVTLDAAALAPGAYDATLCIASNDPDETLVEVPVTLTVTDTMPFLDGFETGDTSRWSFQVP